MAKSSEQIIKSGIASITALASYKSWFKSIKVVSEDDIILLNNSFIYRDVTLPQKFGQKYGQIGVTTAGDIRAAGGNIVRTSGATQYHATVTGLTSEQFSNLLNPTIRNPNK